MLLDVYRLIHVHSNKKCGTKSTEETNGTHQHWSSAVVNTKRDTEIERKKIKRKTGRIHR